MKKYPFKVVESGEHRYLVNLQDKKAKEVVYDVGVWFGHSVSARPTYKVQEFPAKSGIKLGALALNSGSPHYSIEKIEWESGEVERNLVVPVECVWCEDPLPWTELELPVESLSSKPPVVFETPEKEA